MRIFILLFLFIYCNGFFNDQTIDFTIALKQNTDGIKKLETLILDDISNIDSPLYGNYLSNTEIDALIGSSKETKNRVMNWLNKNDLTKCVLYSDSIRCNERIDKVDKVFHTFLEKKVDRYHSDKSYVIPNELEQDIDFIDGVCNKIISYKKTKIRYNGHGVDSGIVSREVLMRMYSVYPTFVDHNVSIGAMEFQSGEGFSNKDLLKSQHYNGVPSNKIPKNRTINNYFIPDGESELDVQVMYWAAADAKLWYYHYSGWMYGWANQFYNRKKVPEIASISWGWSETDQCSIINCTDITSQQYVSRCNVEFMKIIAKGITLVAAAGDAGSPGRTNELCDIHNLQHINPVFPGSSPWILSVGGTYVMNTTDGFSYQTPICKSISYIQCANGTSEAMCTKTRTGWTSGAAFAKWSQTPEWQREEVQAYLNSDVSLPDEKYYNPYGRAYPDVSAFGHNCIVYDYLIGWVPADGTSCASPVFAGIIANLNAFQKSRNKPLLGFINPLLYKMGRDMPFTFNDITQGNSTCTEATCCGRNFGFIATKGWDVVSGLGSPNVEAMKRYLIKY